MVWRTGILFQEEDTRGLSRKRFVRQRNAVRTSHAERTGNATWPGLMRGAIHIPHPLLHSPSDRVCPHPLLKNLE